MNALFLQKRKQDSYDYLAPDGSEIRLLPELKDGGLCHCSLPPGKISAAVKHRSVNEIWYCLSGTGEIWQSDGENEETLSFSSGDSFTIPAGNSFQFRNRGSETLCILISTLPKWPGPEEAMPVQGTLNLK